MVKKLFKHEILAWCRILPIVYIIFICLAAMGRFVQVFESDSIAYTLIFTSAIAVYIIGIIACFAFPTVFGITRFYKNLFSGEGYLTFTLPVTPANHIWVKLLVSFMFDIISFIVVVLSAVILTSGEMLAEIIKAINYSINQIPLDITMHVGLLLIEFIFLLLTASLSRYLLFYACIAVGQLFNKNRLLAAVGVYFAYYFVSQIIGTIIGVIFTIIASTADIDTTITATVTSGFSILHVSYIGFIILNLILATVYFLVTHQIIRKRLNLE